MKGFLCFLLAPAFILFACDFFERPEEKVVITVGDSHITADQIKRDLKLLTFGMGMSDREIKQAIRPLLSKLIDRYLILEYGKQNDIRLSENELESAVKDIKGDYPDEKLFQEVLLQRYIDYEAWKEGLRQQLLTKKIIGKAFESISPVTFDEIKGYFDTHQEEFMRPQMVKFSQIVIGTRHEAEIILERLKNGENLNVLARKYSIAPEAETGGEVGWVSKGQLDESIEKVVFSLPAGKISPVIETPYGYHIFEVQERRSEGFKSLQEAIEEVRLKLLHKKQESFYVRWLKQLKGLFIVEVNQQLLETMEIG